MSAKRAFWKWALLGGVTSALLLLAQATAVGGLEGLLQVGEHGSLRPVIEAELGEIPLANGLGHDGQIYYAMALDLDGSQVAELLDHDVYRYRRIAYPLLASGLGLIGGIPLILGMIAVTVVATALASGLAAAIASTGGKSDWWSLAVLLNPGVWLSVRLLTADVTALAVMLLGLAAFLTGSQTKAVGAFALSGLVKEVYLLTPVALAVNNTRRNWRIAAIPAAVVVGWTAWLTLTMGNGFGPRGNIGWPLLGIFQSSANWDSLSPDDLFYLGFALVSVAAGLIFATLRATWLRWPIFGWSILGLVSSSAVWDFGNNAARAFAPIVILIALSAQAGLPQEGSAPNTRVDVGGE